MPDQELQCPFCPKTSSRGTGLASHIRGNHPKQYAGWSKSRKGGQKSKAPASSGPGLTGGLREIIASLEQQRAAIDSALSALREVDTMGVANDAPPAPRRAAARRKGGMTPEGRARLAESMKRRWAVKRAAGSPQVVKAAGKRGRPKKAA